MTPSEYKALQTLATYAVRNALRHGTLTRLPCVVCGNPKSQAHHSDYTQPLLITWLCHIHHRMEHGRLGNTGKYKMRKHLARMSA